MSTPTVIDRTAPVLAHHEIDIAAPLTTVWQLHTDVNAWRTWHADIIDAHLDGTFDVGASFNWTSYSFHATSTIYAIAERARILWGGRADGITGIHEWTFVETPGGVHVTTCESSAGEPVQADVSDMQSRLDASLVAWLNHLKAEAESSR
jgi:uncharacterized protein YndB with AHSA1/START domain